MRWWRCLVAVLACLEAGWMPFDGTRAHPTPHPAFVIAHVDPLPGGVEGARNQLHAPSRPATPQLRIYMVSSLIFSADQVGPGSLAIE